MSPGAHVAGWRQGVTLAFAGFLPILSILSLAPAIPTIISHFKNVPNAAFLVPLMATTPGLMVALLAPFAGVIVDRYGRRIPLLWATFAYAFSGTAPFFLTDLPTIFASRLAVGVSETFILVIVNALFADYFAENRRRNWITVQGLLGPALGAGSLALSGWLSSVYWNGVFLVYGLAFIIFLAMFAWFFEPAAADRGPGQVGTSTPFPWKTVAAYCGVTLIMSILYYVFLVNGGLAFEAVGTISATRLGVIMGLVSLGVPAGALMFNLLSRRWSIDRVIGLVLMIVGAGTAGMGFARSEATMAAAAVLQELGAGMTVTGLIFWVSRLLAPEHRGRGFGLWTSAFFIAQFISPAIVGTISARSGSILHAFAAMGVLGMVFAVVILLVGKRIPQPVA
nr:hypothetical protein TQ38_28375 [Novosphingobium sp. P6W]